MRKFLSNRLFTGLLCLTLIFRVLVPVGYMPDMAALQHGIYKIKICSGLDHQNVVMDQNQMQGDGQNHDSGHKTEKSSNSMCPFAVALASGLAVAWLALAISLLWRPVRYIPKISYVKSVAVISAWPRGPPLHLA